MTVPFTDADVSNMREAQGIHAYTDRALYTTTADPNTVDDYGQPTASAVTISLDCAFVDTTNAEKWRGDAEIETIDAEVFFTGTTPTKGGTITILKRFGQDVTNKTYQIVGVQDRGAYGWVCALRLATV